MDSTPAGAFSLSRGHEAQDTRFYDFHHDLTPQQAALILHGELVWQKSSRGEWVSRPALPAHRRSPPDYNLHAPGCPMIPEAEPRVSWEQSLRHPTPKPAPPAPFKLPAEKTPQAPVAAPAAHKNGAPQAQAASPPQTRSTDRTAPHAAAAAACNSESAESH